MLFSSVEFIFVFLPVTAGIFWTVARVKQRNAHFLGIAWLVLASLFFYSWWNPNNLWIILFSIAFNYLIGILLNRRNAQQTQRKSLLATGIVVNLLLLGYFKYLNFFIDNINSLLNTGFSVGDHALPLAISFFTFQQIGYLVDTYRGETENYKLSEYLLFVSFFPQLIAGPIVHHKRLIPQFAKRNLSSLDSKRLAVGITIFAIGLFKKVILADGIAPYANDMFSAAAAGTLNNFFTAWTGALAYTLQLYFDFSGYSDMAIGTAYLFGIQLPINFNSPYKAVSVVDFWRRWHITLSDFLRDYLYIPLGGNRKGNFRRNTNLMTTMLLGGLWHGAGWTFILWGGLHGTYLIANNQWFAFKKRLNSDSTKSGWFPKQRAQLLTFLAIMIGWVLFRAEGVKDAAKVFYSMVFGYGISLPAPNNNQLRLIRSVLEVWDATLSSEYALSLLITCLHISVLLAIIWLMPNTQELMSKHLSMTLKASKNKSDEAPKSLSEHRYRWKPSKAHAVICGVTLFIALKSMMAATSDEFLYFNF